MLWMARKDMSCFQGSMHGRRSVLDKFRLLQDIWAVMPVTTWCGSAALSPTSRSLFWRMTHKFLRNHFCGSSVFAQLFQRLLSVSGCLTAEIGRASCREGV